MSRTFYADLTPLSHFADVTDLQRYALLPDDWYIVITDVIGSTAAINAGRYKEVNMIGAASIVALLNVAGSTEIPFIFGGDGATLAIPSDLLDITQITLAALQSLSQSAFNLKLRAGIVPMRDLLAAGYPVHVARLLVSEHYSQASFSGGLSYAEQLVKDPTLSKPYLIPPADNSDAADLTGLECRWQDIPSPYGETISLLVTSTSNDPSERARIIGETIERVEAVYGSQEGTGPLKVETMQASTDPRAMLPETRLRAGRTWFQQIRYLAQIWLLNIGVIVYKRYQKARKIMPWWDEYRELVAQTSDYKKFDDTLRMVLAGTELQRKRLEAYLELRYKAGELVYGIHVTDRALMTCLVFERMGRQVHFVDAADGGYALAAKDLKRRLAEMPAN